MSEEPIKNPPSKYLKAILISVGVALLGTALFTVYMEYQNAQYVDKFLSEDYELGTYDCEQWLEEGRFLVAKHKPITNINVWSPEDREKYIDIENRVIYHCTTTKVDVIQNLPLCIETYAIIEGLLDDMIEMEINSLTEADQNRYHSNYDKYFDNDCDLLQDDIDQLNSEINVNG